MRLLRNLLELYQRLSRHGATYRAASLSYASLLSMVPLVIVTMTALSMVPSLKPVGDQIQAFIFHNFVAGSANVIITHLQLFMSHVSKLSMVNLAFLVVMCVLMIYNMSCAFNAIWGSDPHRRLWILLPTYLVVLLLGPLIASMGVLASSYVLGESFLSGVLGDPWVHGLLFFALPYCVTFFSFTLLNWLLPTCHVRLRDACLGGLVTTALFELAKMGFVAYLQYVPTYRLLYGALATIPIFLLWLYITWLMIIFGAECACMNYLKSRP